MMLKRREIADLQPKFGQPRFGRPASVGAQLPPSATPAPEQALVSLRGVEKSYDGVSLVVRDLNLDVARGEFLTLLGPSGSGKTTSLMMLAGFEAPTAGEILLDGRSLAAVPPHRRNIGMVFQSYALFPHLTVEGNLAYPLRMRRMRRAQIEPRVTRALAMVRLEAFRQRRPAQLSGGQQQRVALARALVFEPELVLMDEPLGALDKQLREHMQIEIKHIQEQLGVTVIYVTHDQSRGADDVGSRGGVQRRRYRAGGHAARRCTSGRAPRSSPASSARTTSCPAEWCRWMASSARSRSRAMRTRTLAIRALAMCVYWRAWSAPARRGWRWVFRSGRSGCASVGRRENSRTKRTQSCWK